MDYLGIPRYFTKYIEERNNTAILKFPSLNFFKLLQTRMQHFIIDLLSIDKESYQNFLMLKPHATTFPYPLVEHESIHSPGCQIFTNLTYPFVRSIQQSDRRACINAVLCYFLLIPWRNVGRKRPAGKDPGPYGRGGRNGAKSTDDPILGPE